MIDHLASTVSLAQTLYDGLDRSKTDVTIQRAQFELLLKTVIEMGRAPSVVTGHGDAHARAVVDKVSAIDKALGR